jgi:hypothetical protein
MVESATRIGLPDLDHPVGYRVACAIEQPAAQP